jgi:hypothetical protein
MLNDEYLKRTFLHKHEIIECTIVERISRSIALFGILLYGLLGDFNCGLRNCGKGRSSE